MEGLSAAASAIDLLSLAVHRVESVKKLNKVWDFIKGEQQHMQAVSSELKGLSSPFTG